MAVLGAPVGLVAADRLVHYCAYLPLALRLAAERVSCRPDTSLDAAVASFATTPPGDLLAALTGVRRGY